MQVFTQYMLHWVQWHWIEMQVSTPMQCNINVILNTWQSIEHMAKLEMAGNEMGDGCVTLHSCVTTVASCVTLVPTTVSHYYVWLCHTRMYICVTLVCMTVSNKYVRLCHISI